MADLQGIYDSDFERQQLDNLMFKRYGGMLRSIHGLVTRAFNLGDLPLDDVSLRHMLLEARARAVAIDAQTQFSISAMIADGVRRGLSRHEIAYGTEDGTYKGIEGLFGETWAGRPECLVGSTPISSAAVSAIYRRWYTGHVVHIRTIGGREFTATPNHPHLTSRGWFGAGEITPGDDLICDIGNQQFATFRDQDVQHPPATIEQIFDAVAAVSVLQREVTRNPDFHGDGREGYVDVLRPDRVLHLGVFAPLYQPVIDRLFTEADPARATQCRLCGRLLAINNSVCGCSGASVNLGSIEIPNYQVTRDVVCSSQLSDRRALTVGVSHGSTIEVAAPAGIAFTGSSTPRSSYVGRMNGAVTGAHIADSSADLFHGQSGNIQLDRVLSVSVRQFDGYVFNLSTPSGYFTADTLYTGNTIARTELQQAMLRATVNRFRATGMVEALIAHDGDQDFPCMARNGKRFEMSNPPQLAHPRCTLTVSPILNRAISRDVSREAA